MAFAPAPTGNRAGVGKLGLLLAGLAVLLASGCALPRRIDTDVQSSAYPGAMTAQSYRFVRAGTLDNPAWQERLETMAALALERAGLHSGDAHAQYTAQIDASVQSHPLGPAGNSAHTSWFAHDTHSAQTGQQGQEMHHGHGGSSSPETIWYLHAVHLVLRDAASGRVVYDSTASFDGPWSDSENLLPTIVAAALDAYPQPPAGLRKIVVELPAATASAAAAPQP